MSDIECPTCNDTGLVGRRTRYPMSVIGPGSVPDDAVGVVETRCPDCDPVARFREEAIDDEEDYAPLAGGYRERGMDW